MSSSSAQPARKAGPEPSPFQPSPDASPASDTAWTLRRDRAPENVQAWLTEGSLFALADGVLGVRGGVEEMPGSGGGAFLSRVFERTPIAYHEKFKGFALASDTRVPAPDALRIDVRLGDAALADGETTAFSRALELKTGELTRTTRWRAPGGGEVQVEARRVVFGGGRLALRLRLTSIDYAGPVELASWLSPGASGAAQGDDPRLGAGEGARLVTSTLGAEGRAGWIVQQAPVSRAGVAVAVAHRSGDLTVQDAVVEGQAVMARLTAALVPGRSVVLEKTAVYVPFDGDLEGAGALDRARRLAASTIDHGYDAAARAAAAEAAFPAMDDLDAPGDPELASALRFNLAHVRRSAPLDGRSGLAAKGLTGEGYEGHVFWDAEAFALQALTLTDPARAKSQLAFRVSTLEAARAHARELNFAEGALYPWRTIAGDEGSAYFPSGSAQLHVNAAIAHAVELYDRASGDEAFVAGEAAPMVFETARIWLQAGFHDARLGGAFRICGVTGPDEYSAIVDDDHYTQRMAQRHLRYALELAARAPGRPLAPTPEERARWASAAEAMHLPVDPALRVHPQDAGFLDKPRWAFDPGRADRPLLLHYHPLTLYRSQVIKQASVVLAHALAPEGSRSLRRRDYAYYEPLTAHDSTLSASSHAVVAADLGLMEDAARFLRESVFVDLDDLHANAAHGLHIASMAGGWQALAFGFGGLRIGAGAPDLLPRTAAALPAYGFGLTWRGARLRVEVDAETTRYALAPDGAPLAFSHDGLPVSLQPGERAERPTPRFGAPAQRELRGLVFDLDGVLTDTAKAHYVAWKALADELGIPFDEEANEALKGVDRRGSLELILARGAKAFTEDEKARLAETKNARYLKLIAHFTPDDLLPGARAALERARAAGLPMALASASRNAPLLLERLGIARFFEAVVDPASLARGKPDPEIFLAAAAELGLPPEACLGIEDSRAGLEAIKAAGMPALGVGDPAVLDRADMVVSDLADLDWLRWNGSK